MPSTSRAGVRGFTPRRAASRERNTTGSNVSRERATAVSYRSLNSWYSELDFEVGTEQAGESFRGQVSLLEQKRIAICDAQPFHEKNWRPRLDVQLGRHSFAGRFRARRDQPSLRAETTSLHLLAE